VEKGNAVKGVPRLQTLLFCLCFPELPVVFKPGGGLSHETGSEAKPVSPSHAVQDQISRFQVLEEKDGFWENWSSSAMSLEPKSRPMSES